MGIGWAIGKVEYSSTDVVFARKQGNNNETCPLACRCANEYANMFTYCWSVLGC